MYGISFDHEKAVQQIRAGRSYTQDCCRVTYHGNSGPEHRYFMNVAGIGYDALVAQKTNREKEKGKGSPLTYLWFVFEGLFQYRFLDAVIEVDGEIVLKGEIFSMNVGICRYNGGGMKQLPYAIPDDGLLDVTLIMKTSKWMVVRHASKLYSGTLVNLPIVKTFRGKGVRIRSTGKIFLETDGESLGHSPFTFEVIPGSVRVIGGELAL
jgi:diacylglycerol kinase family enzyme